MHEKSQKTILLVEDEVLIAMAEKMELGKYGYVVVTSSSGEKALDAIKNNPSIDLVLMDINLGNGIDGTEAARLILNDRDLPIVFLSSHTEPEVVEKTEKITSYGYVVKSSSITVLDASIKMAFKLFYARQLLSEKQITLEAALDSMTDAVGISDSSGNLLEFNDAFSSFHRFRDKGDCATLLSAYSDIIDIFTEDGQAVPLEMWAVSRALRGERATNAEYGLLRKDTGESWVGSFNFSPIRDKVGQIVGSVVVGRDITEQKRIDDKIKASEELFSKIFEASPNAISITDMDDSRISDVNDEWCALTGYSREEAIGHDVAGLGIIDIQSRAKIRDTLNLSSRLNRMECTLVTKKGDAKDISVTATLLTVKHRRFSLALITDITNLKRAEEELHARDIRLRKLFANIPDLVYQFTRRPDGSYHVPIASQGIRNIFGCSPEDVLEDFGPIGRVIHPEDAARVIADIEYSAEHLSYFTCEFRVILPGKGVQWIYSRSSPERLPDGSVTWHGFNANITQMKLKDVENARAKVILQASIESPKDLIIMAIDRDYRYLCFNSAHSRAMKVAYGKDIAIGMSVLDCITSQVDLVKAKDNYDRAFRGESHSTLQVYGDLNNTYFESSYNPIYNNQGEVIGITAFARDITEWKRAEAELRESYETLRLFVQNSPIYAYLKEVVPGQCRIIVASENHIDMIGVPGSRMIGLTNEALFPPEIAAKITADDWSVASGDQILHKNETLGERQYTTIKFPINIGGRRLLGGYSIDITEQKLAEDSLRKSHDVNLELLHELQHRVKNCFGMISSMVQLAAGDDVSIETKRTLDYLGTRVRSVSELYDLLYSKESFTEVDFDDYCTRVVRPLIALAGNISLKSELESVTVSVRNAATLGLIITELVTNAVKYAFPADRSGTLLIGLKRIADGKAALEITDDGIGLPVDFDIVADAGMGLSLVQGLVEQVDGYLYLDRKSAGTRWILEFGLNPN